MCTPCDGLSCGGLVAEFVGPLFHFVDARPIGIHESDRSGWTCGRASGIAATQITFLDLASFLHIVDRAKRTSNRAHLATHTGGVVDLHRPRCFIFGDGLDRTGMQTPSLITLRAGVGHLLAGFVEVKHLDT